MIGVMFDGRLLLGVVSSVVMLSLLARPCLTESQANTTTSQGVPRYSVKISVDEVSLIFRAVDAHGFPISDIKPDELSVLDNGKPARKILSLQSSQNLPIRAGILMDASPSMEEARSSNQQIAIGFGQQVLRQQTDQAFVMNFGVIGSITQDWTNNQMAVAAAIGTRRVLGAEDVHIRGTAIFNALYQACLNQFGHISDAASTNVIMLFSDGEDNASLTSLEEAVSMCQRTNTSIYAFRPDSNHTFSTGPKTLVRLTAESGGRVFYEDNTQAAIYRDIMTIETDLRSQYRLVYRPAELRHDGLFHHVELKAPKRLDSVLTCSGYYSPVR